MIFNFYRGKKCSKLSCLDMFLGNWLQVPLPELSLGQGVLQRFLPASALLWFREYFSFPVGNTVFWRCGGTSISLGAGDSGPEDSRLALLPALSSCYSHPLKYQRGFLFLTTDSAQVSLWDCVPVSLLREGEPWASHPPATVVPKSVFYSFE